MIMQIKSFMNLIWRVEHTVLEHGLGDLKAFLFPDNE